MNRRGFFYMNRLYPYTRFNPTLSLLVRNRSSSAVYNMTSSEVVVLNPQELPEVSVQSLKQDAAQKTSDLLTENTRKHHIFFNESGFHNHIVHHLLTVYALGASPPTLEKQYKINAAYQRGKQQADESTVEKLRDRAKWDQYLGKEKYYSSFLVFFQQEINEKGWEEVLKQCLFSQTEHSDDLLVRMFGGKQQQFPRSLVENVEGRLIIIRLPASPHPPRLRHRI